VHVEGYFEVTPEAPALPNGHVLYQQAYDQHVACCEPLVCSAHALRLCPSGYGPWILSGATQLNSGAASHIKHRTNSICRQLYRRQWEACTDCCTASPAHQHHLQTTSMSVHGIRVGTSAENNQQLQNSCCSTTAAAATTAFRVEQHAPQPVCKSCTNPCMKWQSSTFIRHNQASTRQQNSMNTPHDPL
jgi:hypothetical protein